VGDQATVPFRTDHAIGRAALAGSQNYPQPMPAGVNPNGVADMRPYIQAHTIERSGQAKEFVHSPNRRIVERVCMAQQQWKARKRSDDLNRKGPRIVASRLNSPHARKLCSPT
jgi:hypothetical protein